MSLEWKEKARIEHQTKRPVGQPRTNNLKLVSGRIPRPLLAKIEKAKSNSHDSRNQVIGKVLEQYFNGEFDQGRQRAAGLLKQHRL